MGMPIIEGYVVERLIKEGGFGSVYLVKRMLDKKTYAIKILHPKINLQAKARAQFAKEISLLSSLSHPYIVKVFGPVKDAPRAAMLMEYFESETLKELLVRKAPLLEEKGVGVFRRICEALKYLHECKIVHKDIKPENILVAANGEVRLIDFSIAEEINFWATLRTILQMRKRDGTPLYMSPEQVKKETVDGRSDIYSLGAAFYQVFGGRPHITAGSEKALLQQHLKAVVPKMRNFNKKVPHQLDAIVMRMLQKHKEERYQSMSEVLFDLNRYTSEDRIGKASEDTTERVGKATEDTAEESKAAKVEESKAKK
jgi:serine/threonine-protein kinase